MTAVFTVTLNPACDKTVTVESFVFGELNRIADIRSDAGGKGINVAKVLKHFSVDVTAWGIGAGMQGRWILDRLHALGIHTHFLEAPGETRTNIKIVEQRSKRTTELNEPGIPATPALLREFTDSFERRVGECSVVVLGGSLPPGTPSDFYKTLVDIAQSKGVRVVLDADGEALIQGLEGAPYAIKPNIQELEALFGKRFASDEQIVSAARSLMNKGVRCVLVSMGGDGSILVGETDAIRAKPFPITPLSTVGAGDSMVAAMVYCMLRGTSAEEMARWTSAAGTLTASKPGTQVCSLDEVRDHLGLVHISSV